jgi:hypothetical protein
MILPLGNILKGGPALIVTVNPKMTAGDISYMKEMNFFLIDTYVSLASPSLQLRLTTSLFSNLDSTLKTNTQYLGIVQCRVLVLICSHILLRSCLAQIPLALCFALNSDHYAHYTVPMAWSC